MKKEWQEVFSKYLNRRNFLGSASKTLLALASVPFLGSRAAAAVPTGLGITASGSGPRTLLTNGLVVDGTGKAGYIGSVLISGDTIQDVAPGTLSAGNAAVIDCTGKVIAPGFIDAHSHMDWYLPVAGHEELKTPFTAQGITTFVAGNCGYGVAGFKKDTPHRDLITAWKKGLLDITWDSMEDYFARVKQVGMTHNLVNLAGHGTTRTSIRGFEAGPMADAEMTEMLSLLEAAIDQGAYGVSFGLQYEPGLFASTGELTRTCELAKKKDKVVTVHSKAYSTLSGTYPMKPLGAPHNLIALKEMLDIAKQTGVKLELSHLIFVGSLTWKNYDTALKMIDDAIADGVDVAFDTYAYHCGTSHINVFFPPEFLARAPEVYDDEAALRGIKLQFTFIVNVLGFGFDDIQITYAGVDDLNQYNGMFLSEIAKARGMDDFTNFFDIAKRSNGVARVLNHRYSNEQIVEELMKHPRSLFMTDASVEETGVQNPACFGCFPRFLEWSRDKKLLTLEEAVRKMTGATAERFSVVDRGLLRKGAPADITVFDWNTVKDNNTVSETSNAPTGIEYVFINGKRVLKGGVVDPAVKAGVVVG
jgi:N-acyl-D-amino-acid deacylase